jgi:hypothetical protein
MPNRELLGMLSPSERKSLGYIDRRKTMFDINIGMAWMNPLQNALGVKLSTKMEVS